MRASWILAIALPASFVAPLVAAQTTTPPAPPTVPAAASSASSAPAPSAAPSAGGGPTDLAASPGPTLSASATSVPPPPPPSVPPPQAARVAAPPPVDPPSVPPVRAPTRPPPGTSVKGLPNDLRPGLELSVAAIQASGVVPATLGIRAHMAVTERTFVDLRLPLAGGTLGNPQVGAHQVVDISQGVWLTLGGRMGAPLLRTEYPASLAQATTAYWDFHDFADNLIPFALQAGLEAHVSAVELRVHAEPLWGISLSKGGNHLFAFQHAVEAQVGHTFGAGVRYQGVLFGTDTNTSLDPNPFSGPRTSSSRLTDRYQGSFELFLRAVYGPIFGRLGLYLPSDAPLSGSTNSQWWGVRASTGYQFD